MEDNGSKTWKKISETLFKAKPEPFSEAFVQDVMRRIEANESRPRLIRIPAQWFAPVMGMAAMLMLALLPSQAPMSAEMLIMGGATDSASRLVLSNGSPGIDEMLGFIMEGI